ncbi:MAG: hypothetical protein LBS01_08545 [Prevotellaceae bacterium]|jgi:hypothetical protein|nr:hypothetical protein [Prevotellaceae bacterium]
MKKILGFFMLTAVLAFAGCGGGKNSENSESQSAAVLPPLQNDEPLADGETFYAGQTTEMDKVDKFEIGLVMAADKKTVNKIIVRYQNLNCEYMDGNVLSTIIGSSGTSYYYGPFSIDSSNEIVWDDGSNRIANLTFDADGATGFVSYSYSADGDMGKKIYVPIGSATIRFSPQSSEQ